MRGISTNLDEILKAEFSALASLVTFELATPVRFCDFDIDLYENSNKYISTGLKLGDTKYTLSKSIDQLKLEIDNTQLAMSSFFLTQEMRGVLVTIKLAGVDDKNKIVDTVIVFRGKVNSVSIDEKQASITLQSLLLEWKKKVPKRTYQPSCPYTFKSANCGYSGSVTSCDKSYNKCLALSNTENFGGFRFIPFLEGKEILWGKKSE